MITLITMEQTLSLKHRTRTLEYASHQTILLSDRMVHRPKSSIRISVEYCAVSGGFTPTLTWKNTAPRCWAMIEYLYSPIRIYSISKTFSVAFHTTSSVLFRSSQEAMLVESDCWIFCWNTRWSKLPKTISEQQCQHSALLIYTSRLSALCSTLQGTSIPGVGSKAIRKRKRSSSSGTISTNKLHEKGTNMLCGI